MWGFFQHRQIGTLERAWGLSGTERRLLRPDLEDALPVTGGELVVFVASIRDEARPWVRPLDLITQVPQYAIIHAPGMLREHAVAMHPQWRVLAVRPINPACIHFRAGA